MYFTSKHHKLKKHNIYNYFFKLCYFYILFYDFHIDSIKILWHYKFVMQSMWSFPKKRKCTHELINMNHIVSSHTFHMLFLVTKLDLENSYPYTIWASCCYVVLMIINFFFLKCFHMVFHNSSLFMSMSNLI